MQPELPPYLIADNLIVQLLVSHFHVSMGSPRLDTAWSEEETPIHYIRKSSNDGRRYFPSATLLCRPITPIQVVVDALFNASLCSQIQTPRTPLTTKIQEHVWINYPSRNRRSVVHIIRLEDFRDKLCQCNGMEGSQNGGQSVLH
jgi:hypothetical protein